MQTPRYLHSFAFVVLFLGAMFLFSPSRAQAQEETKTPVATFFYFGEKITLYKSMFPNYYMDQRREMWVPMLDIDSKIGHGRYQYKKASLATQEETVKLKQLAGSEMPGVYYDHRGEQWIKSRDPDTQKTVFIRLEQATQSDVKNVPEANSLTMMWWHQAKHFPAQDLKFSIAQFIVQMTACYGTNVLTFTKASSSDPACTTEFFKHLLDPKALAGFYMFMVASGYTTETTMRFIELSHKLRGTGISNAALRQKFMPYLGYFGMVAGSLASSLTENILSNKYWPACIALIKREGLANEYCIKVITSFASDEEFWRQFWTSVPSLLLSSVAAHFTQQVVVKNYHRWMNSRAFSQMNVKVLHASEAVLKQVARVGPRAVLSVRFVGGIVGGVPGVIVIVVTEVGQFVGFLQFEKWFSLPLTRAVNDLIETNKTDEGIEKLTKAVDESHKIGWSTAVSNPVNCVNKRISRVEIKTTCDQEESIPAALALLNTGAKNFRKLVLINKFEEANTKWSTKVAGFMNNYRATKLIIQHVYAHRKDHPKKTSLSLATTSELLIMQWLNAIDIEASSETEEVVRRLRADLNAIGKTAGNLKSPLNSVPAKITQGLLTVFIPLPLQPFTGVLLPKMTTEEQLRKMMLDFQKKSEWYASNLFTPGIGSNFCVSAPRICSAFNTTQNIDFATLPMTEDDSVPESLTETREFLSNLSGLYGNDTMKKVFGDLFCNNLQNDFSGHNITDNGRAAAFISPLLIHLPESQMEMHLRHNCTDGNFNRKFSLDFSDFQRPWVLGGRVFSDPISLLMDKDVSLTLGATEDEASISWQARAFPIGSEFLKNMTVMYQKMLVDDLFPEIPEMTGADLIHRTQPHMRGSTLDYSIVSVDQSRLKIPFTNFPVPLSVGERPLLSESLLGHVIFILDKLKYKGPDFPGKHKLCDRLVEKYADHITGLNFQAEINPIISEWDKYENDIRAAGVDQDALVAANTEFALRIAEAAFTKERIERANKESKEIYGLIDNLYEQLANYDPKTLDFSQTDTYMTGIPLEEASNLSTEEYKKYIFYQLEYNTLTNILVEIDEIYDKLKLQVFSTVPESKH